jgi:hypothetical protein
MTIYYVNNNGGADTNDGLSEVNAFETIQKAVDTFAAAGDIAYIKGGVTYTENVFGPILNGTQLDPIRLIGYSATPGDYGRVVWTPSTSSSWTQGNNTQSWYFENLSFDDTDTNAFAATNADWLSFFNCSFDNNAGSGLAFGDNNYQFAHCQVLNNGAIGLDVDSTSHFIGVEVFGTSSTGIRSFGTGKFYKCALDRTTASVLITENAAGMFIKCTMDGKDLSNALMTASSSPNNQIFVENILTGTSGAAGEGLDMSAANYSNTNIRMYNLAKDCDDNGWWKGTGQTEIAAPYGLHHYGNTEDTLDPVFTDRDSSDYTLSGTSGAIGAGLTPGLIS